MTDFHLLWDHQQYHKPTVPKPTVQVKASVTTNLHTEFLLQVWKQQEDSAWHWLATDNKTKQKGQNTERKEEGKSKTDIKRKPNKTALPTSLKAKGPTGQGTNPIFFKASDKVARAHLSCWLRSWHPRFQHKRRWLPICLVYVGDVVHRWHIP